MFLGRITKHHLVQIDPVAMSAAFCVRESFSAGRRKSEAPARTTPHFMTGAQKCTVLIPTSLVHNLWNRLWGFSDAEAGHGLRCAEVVLDTLRKLFLRLVLSSTTFVVDVLGSRGKSDSKEGHQATSRDEISVAFGPAGKKA